MTKCPCGELPLAKANNFCGWYVICPKNKGIYEDCGHHQYMAGGYVTKERAIEMWNKLLKGQL